MKILNSKYRKIKTFAMEFDLIIGYCEIDDFSTAEHLLNKLIGNCYNNDQIINCYFQLGSLKILKSEKLIGKFYLEYIIVNYFEYLKNKPIQLFQILNQLIRVYLEEIDLNSSKDCLDLAISIYNQNNYIFINKEGQHEIYYKTILESNKFHFKIIESLFSNEIDLGKVYSIYFSEVKKYRDSLHYFDNKVDIILIQSAILNCEKEETILKILKYIGAYEYNIDDSNNDIITLKKGLKMRNLFIF